MTEIPSTYDPKVVEGPVFTSWMTGGYFGCEIVEGVRPYAVVIPPPNVTGSLHMGHALNNTIQDVVARRQRMLGRPTRWVVGTDHAGIATQNKVEQKLAREGKDRHDLGRDAFVEACWEWRREHGSIIIEQLKRMGCSCDYSDEWFTMDESYQRAVRRVFIDWFEQGLIYRGKRIINWCPRCTTALSDIEVEHEDLDGHLWHIRYPLATPSGGIDHVVVATTRPETMLGDTCVAVHPDDDRYRELVGATVVLPLMEREIPIVADDYVDPSFGTGAVKVTPAHDPNDFEIGERHDCPKVNVLEADGTVSAQGGAYAGLDRYEARRRIVADLDEAGLLVRIDDHVHSVGHCYRCHTVVEPWLSDQWFVDMQPLAAPAIEAVRDGRVTFHPKRWENIYFHWMENIRDWCISRQLWWGHRIPVFYCDGCGWIGASMEDREACPACGGGVRQDEDVLDTWFSSQLWPFATFGWPGDDPRLDYFYPTSMLSTARDILFLWVARMIMSGMYCMDGAIPFDDVIIHPTVFNAEGRRMSKSLGTGVDPLDLMEHYGADGMRFGLMLQVTGAQDLKFSEEKLVSSRNFANKIWNASRFVLMNLDGYVSGAPDPRTVADRWILSRLANLTARVDEGMETYEFGEVSRALYDFFWSEYCDWYIELAKGRLTDPDQRASVQRVLVFVLDQALRLLHPFMPFVTEAIWREVPHLGEERAASLMVAAWPDAAALAGCADEGAERSIERLIDVVSGIRAVRARYQLPPKQRLSVVFRTVGDAETNWVENEFTEMSRLAGVDEFVAGTSAAKPPHSATVLASGLEVYVPLEGIVDFEAEAARLRREQDKVAAEHEKLTRKLGNEGFLSKAAPEIIAKDRARAAELAETLEVIEAQLAELES